MNKKEKRNELKAILKNYSKEEIIDLSLKTTHHLYLFLKDQSHPVRALGLYAPMSDEVQWNLSPKMVEYLDLGINTGMVFGFPNFSANVNAGMNFLIASSSSLGNELKEVELFNKKMLVPVSELNKEFVPDCLLIPGLGFNSLGFRLGRGKGYYDRYLLGKSSLKIGLTFDSQVEANFLQDDHDIPMDVIITESGIRFRK